MIKYPALVDVFTAIVPHSRPEAGLPLKWIQVGRGHVNSDDTIEIVLDAGPINGRLRIVLREEKGTQKP